MASETTVLRIPIVDLSGADLKPGSHAWAAARAQIRAALDVYGCFEAVHDTEPREAAFAAAKELFTLPVEAKMRNVSDKPYHGYIGQIPGLPGYESMAVDDNATDPASAAGFTRLMWPQGNPAFCETILEFATKAAELDGIIRRMVLESMGVEERYESHTESTRYLLRFSKYAPPGPEAEAKATLGSHVDGNLCTLVYQNHVHGLEVQARSGDWIPMVPSSRSAVFFTGDAFRAWSNDGLPATPHRVSVGSGDTRYSIMLFTVPRDEAVIEAPGELVGEGCRPRFKPYRYPDYVKYCSSWATRKAPGGDLASMLTDFCGTVYEPRAQT